MVAVAADELTISDLHHAVEKLRKFGHQGDIYLKVHPKQREVAQAAHEAGYIVLSTIDDSMVEIQPGVYVKPKSRVVDGI